MKKRQEGGVSSGGPRGEMASEGAACVLETERFEGLGGKRWECN